MNFDEIPKILEHIVNVGYKEIVISGINLSDYHSNSGENFLDLLKFISSLQHINIFENIRFRISSIEPQIINEELISIIAGSCNICPHFHIPLQSGSNNVLKQMKRRYNVQQFRNSIEIINNFLPNAFIGLDVISGFPGETEVDFTETKEFISSLKISSLHCFTYSKRSGTPADTMPNQIPKSEKKHRTNQLIDISKNKLETFLRSNIGRELLLLPEKIIDISNQEILPENSYTFGHTENYIGLYVQSEKSLQNQLYKVKFTQIHNNKAIGELL
jgi:threonylcarbamoyladenosine tRNA methylthiotransferase MtaB